MKARLIILTFLLLTTLTHAQTIRRCNNNPGVTGPNVYTSIQAAHDASANGDIIYLEASGTSYGTLSCAKRLTFYGRGYFLGTNPNGNDSQVEAQIGNVSFGNGSSNTLFSGMVVIGTITFGTSLSGITIERTYSSDDIIFNSTCTGATSQYAHSCTIKQCFVNYGGIRGTCGSIDNNANRISIQNTIQNTRYNTSTIRYLPNALVSNCALYGFYYSRNSSVSNCLIDQEIFDVNTCTFANCFSRINTLPAGNGNQNGIDFSNVFIINAVRPDAPDVNYQLSVASPARGAGINGADIGPFGGPNPYVLSGQPPIPIITNLVSPPSGNNNAPLNVKISVRSNN